MAGGQGELTINASSVSPVPIGKSADLEMAKAGRIRWIFPACGRRNRSKRQLRKGRRSHRILRLWVSPASRKRRRGSRRSRIPPRRAHDTLQAQDESIIVGYYTSAEVHPPKATRISTALVGRERSSMARGDGIHRTSARNMRLTTAKLKNVQQHNEREKESYVNQDIVPERSHLNVHFKQPDSGYLEQFEQMEADGFISTRGIKEDAFRYGELIFDVNSAYFFNHGGYDFAKQFYHDAYQAAIKIVGGEQYILSAVMHADERNRAMSEALGQDVYHCHLHVVYMPVVEKQIRWSKRCKDKSLVELQTEKSEVQAEIGQLRTDKAEAEKAAKEAQTELWLLAPKLKSMEKLAAEYSSDPEDLLPLPDRMESAKSYREK